MNHLPIKDIYGRTFKTLRVSLTNSCNLGCVYCVSGTEERIEKREILNVLTHNHLLSLIKSLHSLLNIEVIRLTGGEPTLYRELIPLIGGIKEAGISRVKMTSNGFLLKGKAKQLAGMGLTHLNISLDAVDAEEFYKISRRRNIEKILEGIDEAILCGIDVKINTVIMKGINENQILPLLQYCFDRGIAIRFLELMKMGHVQNPLFEKHFFSQEEILHEARRRYLFKKLERKKSSTANYWMTESGNVFGVVANESSPFCSDCDRLRLDSFGNIYGCLSENKPLSIIGLNTEQMTEALKEALTHKQKVRFKGSDISMLAIGG